MPKEKTPQGYLFPTTGEVRLVDLPRTTSDLLAEWEPLAYLRHIEGDLFFLSHDDNDLPSLYVKSTLPKNSALATYFSESPFLGDVLLVEIDEGDLLVAREWPPVGEVLAPYKMCYRDGRKPPDVDIRRVRRVGKDAVSDDAVSDDEASDDEASGDSVSGDSVSDSSYSEEECERCHNPTWSTTHSLFCRFVASRTLLGRVFPDEDIDALLDGTRGVGLGWPFIKWGRTTLEVPGGEEAVRVALKVLVRPDLPIPIPPDLGRWLGEVQGREVPEVEDPLIAKVLAALRGWHGGDRERDQVVGVLVSALFEEDEEDEE